MRLALDSFLYAFPRSNSYPLSSVVIRELDLPCCEPGWAPRFELGFGDTPLRLRLPCGDVDWLPFRMTGPEIECRGSSAALAGGGAAWVRASGLLVGFRPPCWFLFGLGSDWPSCDVMMSPNWYSDSGLFLCGEACLSGRDSSVVESEPPPVVACDPVSERELRALCTGPGDEFPVCSASSMLFTCCWPRDGPRPTSSMLRYRTGGDELLRAAPVSWPTSSMLRMGDRGAAEGESGRCGDGAGFLLPAWRSRISRMALRSSSMAASRLMVSWPDMVGGLCGCYMACACACAYGS